MLEEMFPLRRCGNTGTAWPEALGTFQGLVESWLVIIHDSSGEKQNP